VAAKGAEIHESKGVIMNEMINPHIYKADYQYFKLPYRPKEYYAVFVAHGRFLKAGHAKPFRTATLAKEHAFRLLARWCRLYDAAIVALTAEPVQVPE
jgi:hypothetical protein